jgi:uncharacterized protein
MNQYLYRIQPVRPAMLSDAPTEEESRLTSEHFAYLKDLTEKGQVILAGRTLGTGYDSFGIIIFCAEDDEAANALVQNDPAVKGRVFRAELHPYRIALFNPDSAK